MAKSRKRKSVKSFKQLQTMLNFEDIRHPDETIVHDKFVNRANANIKFDNDTKITSNFQYVFNNMPQLIKFITENEEETCFDISIGDNIGVNKDDGEVFAKWLKARILSGKGKYHIIRYHGKNATIKIFIHNINNEVLNHMCKKYEPVSWEN